MIAEDRLTYPTRAGEVLQANFHVSKGHNKAARYRKAAKKLYVPPPNSGAVDQVRELWADGRYFQALGIHKMVSQPQAVWFNGSQSPGEVKIAVQKTVRRARLQRAVPVLVSYNLPFRDCAQFSAGGATTVDEYQEWIDGFAAGIGKSEAIVILEPDGLGIIPHYTPITGSEPEWCQPEEADPETAAAERFFLLNAAVDRLLEQPNVKVYLDGTHFRWLGAGDMADRLVQAGVERAAGFFLNASNYESTDVLTTYGKWVSSCIAFGTNEEEGGWRLGNFDWCGSQYYPATLDDPSTYELTDLWYEENLGTAAPQTHFVVDTSRNGQGPWSEPEDHPEGDAQTWCNPPDRGLGLPPSLSVEHELIDAYLWIKIPGESDGECNRWADLGEPDPVRGMVNPGAGQWFDEMALELVRFAEPSIFSY